MEKSRPSITNHGGVMSVPEQLHREGEPKKELKGAQLWQTSLNLEDALLRPKELSKEPKEKHGETFAAHSHQTLKQVLDMVKKLNGIKTNAKIPLK